MCGIAGWIGGPQHDRAEHGVKAMVAAIAHRGPDSTGFHSDGEATIGMCRLSIMDVAGGAQPMFSEDGRIAVVCNGEIYNHETLRKELEGKGHRLRSGSDVEVLTHLYEEHGDAMVSRLRGMFGLAIWDGKRQRLLLARDRVGIKPLFYAQTAAGLLFGSEIKALLATGQVNRAVDGAAVDAFFQFGYVPNPATIYREVRKLPPAHTLVWEAGKITIRRYWDLQFKPELGRSEEDWKREFLWRFNDAVRLHTMSDVPLGAFLSGGVDSGLVVAAMAKSGISPIRTFTIGFTGSTGGFLDERPYARMVAERFGAQHTNIEVSPDAVSILEQSAAAFDEPFADDSVIPSYILSQQTRRHVKVALSGLGGDELFAGYERYLGLKLSAQYDRLPGFLRRGLIERLVDAIPERSDGHYTVNHMKRFMRGAALPLDQRYEGYVSIFSTSERAALLGPSRDGKAPAVLSTRDLFNSDAAQAPLDRALYQDIHTYLPEDILALSDRLSAYHALEVRVPFVDHELLEFSATIPARFKIRGTEKKYLLKRIAEDVLPREVVYHRKQGFASPMAAWLSGDLKEFARETLSPEAIRRHGLLDPAIVEKLLDDHWSRRELNDRKIFALLMFQTWCQREQVARGIR
jgi:asparagine synthase (glutamine-hydrolysing)